MNVPVKFPRFERRTLSELPIDPVEGPQLREVLGACVSRVMPTPTARPELVTYSREMAELLGLSPELFAQEKMVAQLAGCALGENSEPYAACYGGHQFGSWAGQLGDGRAISLGELPGRDGQTWELQLKGAGPTPYSRRADGRAVLRSSIREFLCSEAMHHLGVPTTRALSLCLTGDEVVRDMFYDGRASKEPGAVVCRVAPSFLRFGSFEIFSSRGDEQTLRALVGFSLKHFFPQLCSARETATAEELVTPEAVAEMFGTVAERTALMITEWMRVGFVHGVMNTDNMSLLGLTIDYGPYGWLDDFDPNWTPNTTDAAGRRYRYGNQPRVGEWNLMQLGNALVPLVGDPGPLNEGLRRYQRRLDLCQTEMMRRKLGLATLETEVKVSPVEGELPDAELVRQLFDMLQLVETDMTLFFRQLADLPVNQEGLSANLDQLRAPLESAYYDPQARSPDQLRQIDDWLRAYVRRGIREREDGWSARQRVDQMNSANPRFVLRNYLAQQAIDAATAGDFSEVEVLLDVMRRPYDEQPGLSRYAEKRPEWARHKPGCSTLSCSS